MDWYKRKCEITVAYLRHRPSTFWKTVEKSGEVLHWKKRRLSEYVTKVIKNLFKNAILKSLIEKWLIHHKWKKSWMILGWKWGFLKSQKLKFLKFFFYWKLFMWLKNIICWNILTLRHLAQAFCWKLKYKMYIVLNGVVPLNYFAEYIYRNLRVPEMWRQSTA